MSRLILQPCADAEAMRNRAKTLERPVPLDDIARFLSREELELLQARHPAGTIRLWGVQPKDGRNERKWQRIRTHDVALFSAKGQVFAAATVTHTVKNVALAESLWGSAPKHGTWSCIYFLQDYTRHDLPYARLNALLGYSPTAIVQGFQVLGEDKSWAVLEELGLDVLPDDDGARRAEYERFVRRFDGSGDLDARREGLVRIEQPYLRKALFGDLLRGTCFLCGRSLPVQFLDAAHLKPRADCERDERLDVPAIVAPLCRLGCHVLYDRGAVAVHNGRLLVAGDALRDEGIRHAVAHLEGRPVAVPAAQSEYFEWHRRHVFQG